MMARLAVAAIVIVSGIVDAGCQWVTVRPETEPHCIFDLHTATGWCLVLDEIYPTVASCHDLIGQLSDEWSPETIGYTVICHPGHTIPNPNPGTNDVVFGYTWLEGREVHLADLTSVHVAAHEVAHIVLGHDGGGAENEAAAWALADQILGRD